MVKYIQAEIMAFKKSFKIKNFWKIYGLEIVKILLLLVIVFYSTSIIIKSFTNMQPMFTMLDEIRGSNQAYSEDMAQKVESSSSIFNQFTANAIKITAAAILLIIFITAIIDSTSFAMQKDKNIELKAILKNIAVYLTICIPTALLIIWAVYGIADIILLEKLMIILAAVVAYLVLMMPLSITQKYFKSLLNGLKNALLIHKTIIPIIIAIFALVIFFAITAISAIIATWLFVCAIILLASLLLVWVRNYMYQLLIEFKHVA